MRVADLFAVGLGCDFAGAYLLGRGLLISHATILQRATPYHDFHRGLAVGQAEDRVDGLAGIGSLLAGFTIQAVAYAAELRDPSKPGSWLDAIGLFVTALIVAGALIGVWLSFGRKRVLRRTLVELARYDRAYRRHELPSARRLQDLGMALGIGGTVSEVTPGGPLVYAQRVFGVEQTREGDEL